MEKEANQWKRIADGGYPQLKDIFLADIINNHVYVGMIDVLGYIWIFMPDTEAYIAFGDFEDESITYWSEIPTLPKK